MPRARAPFVVWQRLTFATLLIGYMGYYLCRQNFAVAIAPMSAALGLDKIVFGTVASVGTLLYAAGKFATGAVADERGGRLAFLVGLWGSVAASLFFGAGTGVGVFFVAWGANRLFQSMGWAGLVNVLAHWFPRRQYGTAMGLMTISYQFGGAVALGFAGLLLKWGAGWRGLFGWPALALAVIGVGATLALRADPRDVGHALPDEPGTDAPSAPTAAAAHVEARTTYGERFGFLLRQPVFLVMCALSFVLTFLRECFSLWMPDYFAELGAAASTAAFKSAVFPLLGCLGTLAAGWYSDRHLSGRRTPIIAASLGALTLALAGLALLAPLARATGLLPGTLAVVLVGAAGFFLLAPYSMVGGGVVALDFGGRKTAGTAAGLLDGVGYFAASAAGYAVAKIVVVGGWPLAYGLMAGLSFVSVATCLALMRVSRA